MQDKFSIHVACRVSIPPLQIRSHVACGATARGAVEAGGSNQIVEGPGKKKKKKKW
jgi:hypothetical protein